MSLAVIPRAVRVDANGNPRVGAKLYFFDATSTTPRKSYTTPAFSAEHTYPIPADSNGVFPAAWFNPADGTGAYKRVVRAAADDGSGTPLESDDNLPFSPFDQASVGLALYPRTAAEIAATVTPTNYAYVAGDVRRYGAVGDGSTSDQTAFANAALVSATHEMVIPPASTRYRLTAEITLPDNAMIRGCGSHSVIRQETRNQNIFNLGNNASVDNLYLEGDNVVAALASADKNVGIYATGKTGFMVSRIRGSRFQGGVVQVRDCSDYTVDHCVGILNPYSTQANGTLNGDFVCYSVSAGKRGIWSHCLALSNNDFGFYHNANGVDFDVIYEGCIAVATDGAGAEVASGGNRRHAFIMNYGGGAGGRTILSNCIARNATTTGINREAGTTPTGTHIFANCHISNVGYLNNSLCAGIMFNGGSPGDKAIGCTIESFRGSSNVANAAVVINNCQPGVEIANMTIKDSLGHGLLILGTSEGAIVDGCVMRNNALADLVINHSGQGTAGGGHSIDGMDIRKLINTKPGIRIISDGAAKPISIRARGRGLDSTTASAGENAFVSIEGSTATPLVLNLDADTFYYGVFGTQNIPSGRGFAHLMFDGSVLRNLNTGLLLPRASSADVVVACSVTFISVTTKVSGCYTGVREGDRFRLTNVTAAPSDGTWIAGDAARYDAPAAAGVPGSNCTTGGAPGTWKGWPALAA